eukprot:CAMPEP_0206544500 /NCGR_PEP_ID=MMETSP0325_2-20121206/11566_1 /ASSEMBLY_ACC=CAM_ASM_000347 /TAXON_ID=2866 /ORGANISM="Crypthecodinium cohnii, Strain Seligo" /LENGTH=450 /DNA_ID=CAMNT_0054043283 /DNA_START=172 /DNA_END=1525 /DNA_ORIENTATION=-
MCIAVAAAADEHKQKHELLCSHFGKSPGQQTLDPDRTYGVTSSLRFQRFWRAPNLEPHELVSMLSDLEQERSCDVHLFGALSSRFYANVSEFFPPQVDAVLGSFARLGYADEALLRGFAGRLTDLASDASPRRVVRLLKHATMLELPPHVWLEGLLPQLEQKLPYTREGLPTILECLHTLQWKDPELVKLLVTQGLIVADELNVSFFTKLFERFSRHGLEHKEATQKAVKLASSAKASMDFRDALNLLAGLKRISSASEAANKLESSLVARLDATSSHEAGGKKSLLVKNEWESDGDRVAVVLDWMERLSLQSAPLLKTCTNLVETEMAKDKRFARSKLPGALHSLAALSTKEELPTVLALLSTLLKQPVVAKYDGEGLALLFRAAASMELGGVGSAEVLTSLLPHVARSVSQLPLMERRLLLEALDAVADKIPDSHKDLLGELQALPSA